MTPRTYPPRKDLIAFRISPVNLAEVDAVAQAETAGDRSAALRLLLNEALAGRAAKPTRRTR
jgi:hypothetical protein